MSEMDDKLPETPEQAETKPEHGGEDDNGSMPSPETVSQTSDVDVRKVSRTAETVDENEGVMPSPEKNDEGVFDLDEQLDREEETSDEKANESVLASSEQLQPEVDQDSDSLQAEQDTATEMTTPTGSLEALEHDPGSVPSFDFEDLPGSDDFNLTLDDLSAAAESIEADAETPFHAFNATTPADKALFWSGFGSGGTAESDQLASELGLETLGMMLRDQNITPPDDRDALGWGLLSREMALSASGTVYVTAGDYLHYSAVWARIEQPTLMNNPNVTSILAIDPYTGEVSRTIFTRESPSRR